MRDGALRANVGARSALARDSAPMINSPAPAWTVDRTVTVPETEGRLLAASRLLSPRGHEKRARTPSRRALRTPTRKPSGNQGRKDEAPEACIWGLRLLDPFTKFANG